jgi:hypothetical protein
MDYKQQAEDFAVKHSITLKVGIPTYGKHFSDDKEERYIYPCTLKRNGKSYSFKFGQSLAAGYMPPTMYDILACMQKNDVGSFDDFVYDFGYSLETQKDYKSAEIIYKAVCKESKAMQRLFGDIMNELQEIN